MAWLNVKFFIWRIFHVYHLKLSVFLFMYTFMTPMWVPPLSSVSPGPLVYFEVKGHQSFSLTLTCHYVQRILQGMTSATKPALSVCVHILHTSLEGWSFWQFSFPMKITVERDFINPNIMRMLKREKDVKMNSSPWSITEYVVQNRLGGWCIFTLAITS